MTADTIGEIVRFWFEELRPEDWYRADTARDAEIAKRFGPVYARLRAGVPPDWLDSPQGVLAKRAIEEGIDEKIAPMQRAFIYMPFQHSEAATDLARSIELFTALGLPLNLDFALRHRAVIDRFGRFPHRNAVLSRTSTEEELAFLKEPGSSF
jgi:uncharacterized protein (DUF924 family)